VCLVPTNYEDGDEDDSKEGKNCWEGEDGLATTEELHRIASLFEGFLTIEKRPSVNTGIQGFELWGDTEEGDGRNRIIVVWLSRTSDTPSRHHASVFNLFGKNMAIKFGFTGASREHLRASPVKNDRLLQPSYRLMVSLLKQNISLRKLL
jgi:hypothetical protein